MNMTGRWRTIPGIPENWRDEVNENTKLRLRKIDAIIRKIRIVQSEATYTSYFDQAIECLKLTKLQIAIDGENRDSMNPPGRLAGEVRG